jgi:hypothetical protein
MKIDMQITFGAKRQVDEAVARELLQHVIEEADAGRDVARTGAVEIDGTADLGLTRDALDAGLTRRQSNDRRTSLGHV